MIAKIRFSSIEEATTVIKKWQEHEFRDLGEALRMDFAKDEAADEPPPHYQLCVSGFSGWNEVVQPLLDEFQYDIWRITARESYFCCSLSQCLLTCGFNSGATYPGRQGHISCVL
jgi:hypothetical protein